MRYISDTVGQPDIWQNKAERYKLVQALRGEQLDTYLNALTATNPIAVGLKEAQIKYMAIEESGGWPSIDDGPLLTLGVRDDRVPTLRQRLIATSDLSATVSTSQLFDQQVQQAVKHFQRRHNLPADGVVGQRTLRALNVPVHRRLASIRLSRARAQSLPNGSRADYVWVNIAGAQTHLVRNQNTVWSGRSVVGKPKTKTPELHSEINTLVLNPFWLVPDSITQGSLLPRAAKDPDFLASRRYQAFDEQGRQLDLRDTNWSAVTSSGPKIRLMQAPGPRNALGKVKFLFPNEHAVFLHDTPSKKGFKRQQRALSNGCVRVEGALSLATLILEPQGWNRQRVYAELSDGKPLKVHLEKPLPVLTLYLTATPAKDGQVHFHHDNYRMDTASALAQLN